jgi:hypothetical protein
LADLVKPIAVFSVAILFSWNKCNSPGDHVYGLAAMCNIGASYHISYLAASLTVQDVFVGFTLHYVRTTESLEAFCTLFHSTGVHAETSEIMRSMRYAHITGLLSCNHGARISRVHASPPDSSQMWSVVTKGLLSTHPKAV